MPIQNIKFFWEVLTPELGLSQLRSGEVPGLFEWVGHLRSQELVFGGLTTKARRLRRWRRPGRRVCRGGAPLPSRLEGLGEHRKLPQRVQGRAPAKNGFWCILSTKKHTW